MLLYIVRHGETRANVEGYLQGWSDDPLNDNGVKHAEITGQNLKGTKFDVCISSPLLRARETAEILLHKSNNQTPIMYDDRIREIYFGEYEHMDTKEPLVRQFFKEPFFCPQFTNGESVQMVIERTQSFLKELTALNNDKTYLIVTHGCALRAMLNHLYQNPNDYWQGHVPYNCSISILESHKGKTKILKTDMVLYSPELIFDIYQ